VNTVIRGDEPPELLNRRSARLRALEAAKARLEAHSTESRRSWGPTRRRRGQHPPPRQPPLQAGTGYPQCYNAPPAVAETHRLIVASAVNNHASAGQRIPLVDQTRRPVSRRPARVLAGTGYAPMRPSKPGSAQDQRLWRSGRKGTSPRTTDADVIDADVSQRTTAHGDGILIADRYRNRSWTQCSAPKNIARIKPARVAGLSGPRPARIGRLTSGGEVVSGSRPDSYPWPSQSAAARNGPASCCRSRRIASSS
jgi:hypothetical protein